VVHNRSCAPASGWIARLGRTSLALGWLGLGACGNEPAVGIPVDDDDPHTVAREVVPNIVQGTESTKKPNEVDLNDIVTREALTAKVLVYGELTPLDQEVITTVTNTVEAPCEPCKGRTLASCIMEMPDGCENIQELLDRTVAMIQAGQPPTLIRRAVLYTDVWKPIPELDDRPTDGQPNGMPLEVWIDPATASVRSVVDTLDGLDLRGVKIIYRIVPLDDDPVAHAWAAAAIAAESQGSLEAFLRAAVQWRDEQRRIQGSHRVTVGTDDLDVIAISLDGNGFDRERFHRERESPAVTNRIQQDRALATTLGVRVSPSWFADGYRLRGAQSAAAIQRVINIERLGYVVNESKSGLSTPPEP